MGLAGEQELGVNPFKARHLAALFFTGS